jgi:hypothetical protein
MLPASRPKTRQIQVSGRVGHRQSQISGANLKPVGDPLLEREMAVAISLEILA